MYNGPGQNCERNKKLAKKFRLTMNAIQVGTVFDVIYLQPLVRHFIDFWSLFFVLNFEMIKY